MTEPLHIQPPKLEKTTPPTRENKTMPGSKPRPTPAAKLRGSATKIAKKLLSAIDETKVERKLKRYRHLTEATLFQSLATGLPTLEVEFPKKQTHEAFTDKMLERISEITGIPTEQLRPVQCVHGVLDDAHARYSSITHSTHFTTPHPIPWQYRHETLHGIQLLLRGFKQSLYELRRFEEPTANKPYPHNSSEGGLHYIQQIRHKNFKRLIDQQRVDEAIAFMMHPYPEPLILNQQLKQLEEHGFLANGRLTDKGVRWVARRRTPILRYLQLAQQARQEKLDIQT